MNVELSKASNTSIKQIQIYNKKSVRSLRNAQEYGIEQNLTALRGDGSIDSDIEDYLNIEAIRIAVFKSNTIDK